MTIRNLTLIFFGLLLLTGCESSIDLTTVYFVADYDPARNSFTDVEAAIVEAQQSNRHIILEIGGDWCSWCHILDNFVSKNSEIADTIRQNYVVVKVNVSEDNTNDKFLAQYPSIVGYPHFFILDEQGDFLHSQSTGVLEEERSYNYDVFLKFLEKWSPVN